MYNTYFTSSIATYKVTTFHIILVLVNFTSSSFVVEANDNSIVLGVKTFGTFDAPFVVQASPDTDAIPKGGM